jgi:hypothetical protein
MLSAAKQPRPKHAETKSAEANLAQRMIDAEARRVQFVMSPVAGRLVAPGNPMSSHQGKFIAHFRVSTDRQGKSGLGLEAKRVAVFAYLNGGRWALVQEFVERAASGTIGPSSRPPWRPARSTRPS